MHHPAIEELVRRDPRYPYEAYEFVFAALAHTQQQLGKVPPPDAAGEQEYHVTGPQLLEGIRDLALSEFGLMARTVFRMWGIDRTDDFGEIVFNLVEASLMSKTSEDQREHFRGVFNLDEALLEGYQIRLGDEAEEGT